MLYTFESASILALSPFYIAPLSNDFDDFSYLTPEHFLIGVPLTRIPESPLEFTVENRLNLKSLQERWKWFNKTLNLMVCIYFFVLLMGMVQ